jgi:drug/metabolite transporter (DMT)-like permease
MLSAPAHVLLLAVLASIFTVLGALALSRAFSRGKTSLVAPVVTSYGVVTTLLAWISGDILTAAQLTGILICVFGVVLAAMQGPQRDIQGRDYDPASIIYALLAATLYGSSFWIQGKYALPSLGPVPMLWLGYLTGVIFLLPLLAIRYRALEGSSITPKALLTLCAASILNLGGFSAFAYGTLNGSVSVVTVLSTLSGGIAAVLGYAAYREQLSRVQLTGILFVLLGAVSLHLGG